MNHKRRYKRRQRLQVGIPYKLEGLGYDGDTLTCALCGKHYRFLSTHIWRSHGWTPEDYRVAFGLNKLQPLCVPEISQTLGAYLIQRGLVGRNLWSDSPPRPLNHSWSRQGKHELSLASIGTTRTMNPTKLEAQRNNQRKTLELDTPYICTLCGRAYLGRKADQKRPSHYCPECKLAGKKLGIQRWHNAHPEKSREYERRYRDRIAQKEYIEK